MTISSQNNVTESELMLDVSPGRITLTAHRRMYPRSSKWVLSPGCRCARAPDCGRFDTPRGVLARGLPGTDHDESDANAEEGQPSLREWRYRRKGKSI